MVVASIGLAAFAKRLRCNVLFGGIASYLDPKLDAVRKQLSLSGKCSCSVLSYQRGFGIRPPSPTAALIYTVGHAVLTQVETGLTATLLLLSMCGMVQPLRCCIKTYSHSIRALVVCQIFSMQSSSIGLGEGYERMLWWMCILALTLSSVVAFLLLFNEVGGPTVSNHRNSVLVLP